jgi:hypothetical protein
LSSLLKIPVSVILILSSLPAYSGDLYRQPAGAGEAGMGYVCIMNSGFWTSFHNQASLAFNNSLSFGINYENRFMIKELGMRSAALAIPAGKASLGAVYSGFGYIDYKRYMTGLACGMKLSEKVSAGVQIDYFSERTSGEFTNIQTVTFETGMIILPEDKIRIGIHLFNPLPGSIRKSYMPSNLRIGAGLDISRILFAGIEAEMSTQDNLKLSGGFEYKAADRLWLRSGYSTTNSSFSFGMGYLVKFAKVDMAFVTHEKLGVTSSISIIFKIK